MTETATKDNVKVYEIGFHVAPFVGEDNISHEVEGIKALIEKIKGEVISEDFPKLRPLAYSLSKVIKGSKKIFKECYFGWIKFEADAESIASFTKGVEKLENIVRFLVVKTIRENTLYTQKFIQKEKMTGAPKKEDAKEGEKVEVNEAEVDKAIEELVV